METIPVEKEKERNGRIFTVSYDSKSQRTTHKAGNIHRVYSINLVLLHIDISS